jgi:hypothetical protein
VAFSTAVLCSVLLVGSPASSPAYEDTDYASETVQSAVQSLKDASGNSEQTFKSYENVADIITEGKGVGGTINYKGVQLGTFFVAYILYFVQARSHEWSGSTCDVTDSMDQDSVEVAKMAQQMWKLRKGLSKRPQQELLRR